ncbi:hypothetical protein [Frondihabitans peucedani]|uniref:DUF4062 domain-containing protein n=1 Tax=Frondihabitans peucedani TaxID=598626 RepID=A0ABP8E6C8_9MICO
MNVFVSVGSGLSTQQNQVVEALEDQLRRMGLTPHTVNRNDDFRASAPLDAVTEMMDSCAGVVVVALERFYFARGLERPGSDEQQELRSVRLPTPWNQIEAAMGHSRGLPVLVIIDKRVRKDGLLTMSNNWYVHEIDVETESFSTAQSIGILRDWHKKLEVRKPARVTNPATLTLRDLFVGLKPAQLWTLGGAIVVVLSAAFSVGRFFG